MTIKGYFGDVRVKINKTKYYNGNLCIQLLDYDHEYHMWEAYGNLTVNFSDNLQENFAYVDVNNMPGAEDFIARYKLGKPTGKFAMSGYCIYPLYEFNI